MPRVDRRSMRVISLSLVITESGKGASSVGTTMSRPMERMEGVG